MTYEPSFSWTAHMSQPWAFQQEMASSDLDGTRRTKAGTTWERTGKPSGGETRAPRVLSPMREQGPASGTLSTKLACAGSWDICSERRLFPNDLSGLHCLQILPLVLGSMRFITVERLV